MKCEKCKRFCSNIRYIENGNHDIKRVYGDCKKCGKDVDVEWHSYEDIHPESEEECDRRKELLNQQLDN